MPEQLNKLKRLAGSAGIDTDALVDELSAGIEANIANKLKPILEGIEIKLGQKIEQTGKEMGQTISALVDSAVTAKLPEVVRQVGGEFISKTQGDKSAGGNSEGRSGGVLGKILANASLDDLVAAYKVYKEPTTAEALKSSLSLFMQGMGYGLRLKASPDLVSGIARTIDEGLSKTK